MNLDIIYEDKDIIVIDKPSGIVTHSSENKKLTSMTIVRLVSNHLPQIKTVGEDPLRPGIVHRLDKETSGLMVVAKNNETFFELKKQFQERKVEKKYSALVSGVLEQEAGIIDRPIIKRGTRSQISNFNPVIRRIAPSNDRGKFLISKQIPNYKSQKTNIALEKPALTEYKVLERYNEYTLVEVTPKTGRQHQIRVHFASINHPVACDKLYGRKAKKCPRGLARHFLHATHLKFQLKNALMEFESELPNDLADALESI